MGVYHSCSTENKRYLYSFPVVRLGTCTSSWFCCLFHRDHHLALELLPIVVLLGICSSSFMQVIPADEVTTRTKFPSPKAAVYNWTIHAEYITADVWILQVRHALSGMLFSLLMHLRIS